MNLLRATNPLARILALFILGTPLLLSVDAISAGVSLAWTLLLAPLCGVSWWMLIRRGLPILVAAPISGVSMALYGRPEGNEYFSFFFAHVTDNSLQLALAIMLRVLAIGLPVIVLVAHIDPTELGDGLAQIFKMPARMVISAVAATRMITLFSRDFHSLRRARRARGVDEKHRLRTAFSLAFGLLVLALRRGAKLATAMEARGLGRFEQRTWLRPARFIRDDYLLMIACVIISTSAIVISISVGSFRFLGA